MPPRSFLHACSRRASAVPAITQCAALPLIVRSAWCCAADASSRWLTVRSCVARYQIPLKGNDPSCRPNATTTTCPAALAMGGSRAGHGTAPRTSILKGADRCARGLQLFYRRRRGTRVGRRSVSARRVAAATARPAAPEPAPTDRADQPAQQPGALFHRRPADRPAGGARPARCRPRCAAARAASRSR